MSESQPTSGLPPGSDVKPWWQLWESNQRWQDKLARRATHKALDIPDDDMQIRTSKRGIGAAGLIGALMVATLPYWFDKLAGSSAEPPAAPADRPAADPPAGDGGGGTAAVCPPAQPGRWETWDYRVRSRVVPPAWDEAAEIRDGE